MKDKFKLGIEISDNVSRTAMPNKIRRYGVTEKKKIKVSEVGTNKFYRYRPGVNSFMVGDLDV